MLHLLARARSSSNTGIRGPWGREGRWGRKCGQSYLEGTQSGNDKRPRSKEGQTLELTSPSAFIILLALERTVTISFAPELSMLNIDRNAKFPAWRTSVAESERVLSQSSTYSMNQAMPCVTPAPVFVPSLTHSHAYSLVHCRGLLIKSNFPI